MQFDGEANRWAPPTAGAAIDESRDTTSAQNTSEQAAVGSFVEALANWVTDTCGASTVGDLIAALNGPLPNDLSEALAEITEMSLGDVVPGAGVTSDTSALIVDFLGSIGSDARLRH